MELGQTICTKANPSCEMCPVGKSCLSLKRKTKTLAPAVKKRAEFEQETGYCFRKKQKGILVKRRLLEAKFLKDYVGFPTYLNEGKKLKEDGGHLTLDTKILTKTGKL